MSLQVEGGSQVQVPRALMQAFLQQDPNHPGLETVRLPGPDEGLTLPAHCRELESELCLVCRRCGRAYPQEASLLGHQRSCYLGNQQRRGALRLVQVRFACALCDERSFASVAEWRRHCEGAQHKARQEAHRPGPDPGPHQAQAVPEEANPLTDEMEDVVNQITLLAARAAAESTTQAVGLGQSVGLTQAQHGPGQESNGPDSRRQKLVQEVAALAGAR